MTLKLIIWELLCAALFWSVFCRSVRMSVKTKLGIRLAIWLLGLASLVGLGAPIYDWEPDIVALLILAAAVLMQAVMAQQWASGVPEPFIKTRFLDRNRRSGDSA